jgi:hypothetical protein
MLRWIDRLVEVANLPGRFSSDAEREQVLRVYAEARKVYERIVADAR